MASNSSSSEKILRKSLRNKRGPTPSMYISDTLESQTSSKKSSNELLNDMYFLNILK